MEEQRAAIEANLAKLQKDFEENREKWTKDNIEIN